MGSGGEEGAGVVEVALDDFDVGCTMGESGCGGGGAIAGGGEDGEGGGLGGGEEGFDAGAALLAGCAGDEEGFGHCGGWMRR